MTDVARLLQRRRLLLAAAAALAAAPARATDARPVLVVSGRITRPNDGERRLFTMADLAELPQHQITTTTPWHRGTRRFSGPLLRDVLAAAGAQGQTLRAVALNDYRVDIPIGDVQRYDVVLARLLDGQPMSVREKGPLFIMYPFDRQPELRNAVYFSRCVWQLKSLDVT
jgi:hypothetical protein